MLRPGSVHRDACSNPVARLVWLLLAGAHIPGWYRVVGLGGEFDLPRLLMLTASLVFFALKVADVGWLRFPSSRRFWLVLSVIVVLLHADVLRRTTTLAAEVAEPVVPAVLTLGVLLFIASAPVGSRLVPPWRAWMARARALLAELLSPARLAGLPARDLMLTRAGPSDRAPPAP